jgi:hypothetical protein
MRRQSPIVAARQEARTAALREAIAARRVRLAGAMPNHIVAHNVHESIKYLSIHTTDSAAQHIIRLITAAREG